MYYINGNGSIIGEITMDVKQVSEVYPDLFKECARSY
jgi:hypothetical protein